MPPISIIYDCVLYNEILMHDFVVNFKCTDVEKRTQTNKLITMAFWMFYQMFFREYSATATLHICLAITAAGSNFFQAQMRAILSFLQIYIQQDLTVGHVQ